MRIPLTSVLALFLRLSAGCFPGATATLVFPPWRKRLIDALKPSPNGRDLFIWGGALKGLGLRMKSSGSASFIIQYRTAQGQTRRYAFAKLGTLTPDEARTKARRLLGEVADGGDPSSARAKSRARR